MMCAEMRAAVLRKHATPPEYLQWSIPQRGKGQAQVRVLAAPISPLDLLCASGTSYFGAPKLPYVPGTQGVGIVMEADVLAPGQRVWFSCDACDGYLGYLFEKLASFLVEAGKMRV